MNDISDRFCQNAVIAGCNKYIEDRRVIKGHNGNISDNKELILGRHKIETEPDDEPEVEEEDEFTSKSQLLVSVDTYQCLECQKRITVIQHSM